MSRSDLVVVAIGLVSVADLLKIGYANWNAIALLLLALGAMAFALRREDGREPLSGPIAFLIPVLGLTVALISRTHLLIPQGIGFAGLGLLIVLDGRGWHRWVYMGLAAGLWLAVSASAIVAGPVHIDVVAIQAQGGSLLAHGHDPYLATYPSTTPGVASNPFTYSPVTAMLAALAVPFGDPRWMTLFMAAALVGLLIALAGRGAAGRESRFHLAALVLCLAVIPRMVWDGWTDVYWLAPFAAWLLLRGRWRRSSVLLLAIAMGAKVIIFPFLVPLGLWAPRMRREIGAATALSLVAIYLPFAIWTGPPRLFHDLVGFFASISPPPGTLSISGLLTNSGLPAIPVAVTAAAVLLSLLWLLRREPRSLSDLLVHSGLFVCVGLLLSPWASFNYWMAVVAIQVAAVALSGAQEPIALPWPLRSSRTAEPAVEGVAAPELG